MEPAARSLPKANPDADPVLEFLRLADEVFQTAVAVHDASSSGMTVWSDCSFLKLRDAMSQTLLKLPRGCDGERLTASGSLQKACAKVAQDITIHLQRPGVSIVELDVAKFCAIWPHRDVIALGHRLRELRRTWLSLQDTTVFDEPQSVPWRLSRLKLNSDQAYTEPSEKGPGEHERDKSRNGTSLENAAASPDGEKAESTPPPDMKSSPSVTPAKPRPAPAGLLNDFILESLAYKAMHDREDEVAEAHSQTLKWVFEQTGPGDPVQKGFSELFNTWLKSNELGSAYWITGKPGSGKSTFMRFLSQHQTTLQHLQSWAGARPVCTAGFFFWTGGSKEQRSQSGLLRSLLYQLLSKHTHLIPIAFPDLWLKLRYMTTKERIKLALEWTVSELMEAFHLFIHQALSEVNICLFIDGLDEFDGDHLLLVNLFKGLASGEEKDAIKMCLSSRPWKVFEDAFQQVPSQRLQDLTFQDMYQYTRDSLAQDNRIGSLLKVESRVMHRLITSLVQRADGVFLWTRLAVQKLLGAVRSDCRVADLTSLLESLPTELDDLFGRFLFDDQTESQMSDTAALFQLIRARELVSDFVKDESAFSLTIWELAFALQDSDDQLALAREVCEATDEDIEARCETTSAAVRQRFAGLLETHPRRPSKKLRMTKFGSNGKTGSTRQAESKVTYCHRTVRDWLMLSDSVRGRLSSQQPSGFDPHLRLLRSYVLRLKFPLEEIERHRRLDEWYPDIALAMTHARYVARDRAHLQRQFLNELDSTLSWHWLPKPSDPFDHWARSTFGSYETRMKAPPIRNPFLCLATKFGLTDYVCQELESRQANIHASDEVGDDPGPRPTPLLSYAVEFLCSRNKTIFPLSDPRLAEYLLSHQSSLNPGPNERYVDFNTRTPTTPWLSLLRHLRDARRRGWMAYYDVNPDGTARWSAIVRMFVEIGGADVDAVIAADHWDPEITAVGVLELLEETYGAAEVRSLKLLMEQRRLEG